MIWIALAVLVLAQKGGGSSAPPTTAQTTTPQTQPGQSTGQVVADVVHTVADLFKEYLDGAGRN